MKKNDMLYIVATQYDNLGDLIINKCMVDEIAKHGTLYLDTKNVSAEFQEVLLDNANVKPLSTITDVSLKGKGALSIPFVSKLKFDFLFKSPGPFGGIKSFGEFMRYWVFYYIFSTMKAKGCKSYFLGIDFLIQSKYDSIMQKMFSGVIGGFFLRSKKNVAVLKEGGIKNVEYIPDFCFLMREKVKGLPEKKKVGISFRDLENVALNKNITDAVDLYVDFYLKKNYDVYFFYQVDRDYAFNKQLFEKFKHLDNVYFREKSLKYNEIDFYQDIFSALSNRLHVLLLGQIYGTIPVGLLDSNAKTSKIHNIYDTIGLSNLIFSSLNAGDLEKIYDNREAVVTEMERVNLEQYNLSTGIIKGLLGQ